MPRHKAQPARDLNDLQPSFSQLRLLFSDPVQERYEVARPLLLAQDTSAAQRARETQLHPQTVRRYVRRFERGGMRGLFDEREVLSHGRSLPEIVREEVLRLKTLYPPLHHREIATIIYTKLGARIDHKAVQRILSLYPTARQEQLPFPRTKDYQSQFHDHPDPYQARVEVVKLYYHGWNIQSISGFLGVSRKHIYTLLERFEADAFAGLIPHRRGPQYAARKLYLPVLNRLPNFRKSIRYWGAIVCGSCSNSMVSPIWASPPLEPPWPSTALSMRNWHTRKSRRVFIPLKPKSGISSGSSTTATSSRSTACSTTHCASSKVTPALF